MPPHAHANLQDHLIPPPPTAGPLNLTGKNMFKEYETIAILPRFKQGMFHASEIGQDTWADTVFSSQGTTDLFVVESGAYNGEVSSNSLFLERVRKWKCLLVEANPFLVREVLQKHRNCHVLNGGLSIVKDTAGSMPFIMAGEIGGYATHHSGWHKNALNDFRKKGTDVRLSSSGNATEIQVPTFPLARVVHALGRRASRSRDQSRESSPRGVRATMP